MDLTRADAFDEWWKGFIKNHLTIDPHLAYEPENASNCPPPSRPFPPGVATLTGLYGKYLVVKRSSDQVIHKAFVLQYDKDPFAIPALRAYADACAERYPELAEDLRGEADFHDAQQAKLREGLHRLEQLEAEGKGREVET